MAKYKQFWVFHVLGGDPFKIQIKGNPIQKHDGQRTFIRLLCTDEEAKLIEIELGSHGGRVEGNSPREDEESKTERKTLMGMMNGQNPEIPLGDPSDGT
jgi:hypothetical protein